MAVIEIDGHEMDVPDGAPILQACEILGVPFSCQAGECATCVITVKEGMDNLEERNEAELNMGLRPNERLACQAIIMSGRVVATW